jgi:homogentisate phytyltransferase / homogentisate geranylgeranyltransferase
MALSAGVLWKFSRPHTIYGTAISLIGIYIIAVAYTGATWFHNLGDLLLAELSCLCANVYIVGLNQIVDVEIDRINKPYLPMASGELSRQEAIGVVNVLLIAALGLALWLNPYLFATVLSSVLIGTAYSLPPIRLKRFPLFASLCIFTVRGLIVNVGIFWYFLDRAGKGIQLTPAILSLCLFVTIFTFVIALFKDIPDMEGDQQFNISTFSLRLGKQYVYNLCCIVLVANYLLILAICAFFASQGTLIFLTVIHSILIGAFFWRQQKVDLKVDEQVYDFYQFIWKLYYIEYLVFPLAWLWFA